MEIRKDFLKNDKIIYSSSRSNKPKNYNNDIVIVNTDIDYKVDCPFCESNVNLLNDLILLDENIKARVVKNRYPVIDGELGFHDVAIESYDHDLQLRNMNKEHVFEFLKLIKKRCEMVLEHDNIKNIQIFKNNGQLSGASLEHSHWQILSTNYVPKNIDEIGQRFDEYLNENNTCYLCSDDYSYSIKEDDFMKMVLPKAAASVRTFRIFPKVHKSSFLELNDEELLSLSEMLVFSTSLIDKLEKGNSYNILFYSKPVSEFEDDNFHFFVEVVARKGRLGGFEMATGEYMSSTLPEELFDDINSLLNSDI